MGLNIGYIKNITWEEISKFAMQKIYIDKLLHSKNFIRSFSFEPRFQFELDFSNVNVIWLVDIERLLDLQKAAIFNEIALKVENLEPNISKVLRQTGLYKTLNTIDPVETGKLHKRLALE